MSWQAISSVFVLSTFKFLFAPFTGAGLSLTFFETALASFAGATLSSAFFYFSSKYFIAKQREKRMNNQVKPLSSAVSLRKRKINKMIVRLKWKVGTYGLCYLAPLFLSIPVGTIICAKFYNHRSTTFPLIVVCLAVNSLLLSTLAFFIF